MNFVIDETGFCEVDDKQFFHLDEIKTVAKKISPTAGSYVLEIVFRGCAISLEFTREEGEKSRDKVYNLIFAEKRNREKGRIERAIHQIEIQEDMLSNVKEGHHDRR